MPHLYPLSTNHKCVFAFNVCSFTVWFCCLCRFLILLPLVGRKFLPSGIADFFHAVSLLPLIEVALVKFCVNFKFQMSDLWPLFNGLRMAWVCYGVIFPHPRIAKHTSYSVLILSWCATYVIHYAYYAFRIKTRSSPMMLFWLNYNHYWITFPCSMISEMILTFLALGLVEENSWLEFALKTSILSYIPVAYFEWGHIHTSRKQRFRDLQKKLISASRPQPTQEPETLSPDTVRAASVSPHPESIELRNLPSAVE